MPYDLVDADGFFLVTPDGYVADDSCSSLCCNACPSWRELIQCDSGSSDPCTPPQQRHVWICSTVVCTNGEPLQTGTVVFIDDHCFTVQPGTQPTPPPGADIIQSRDPVQCVNSCTTFPCPVGDLWYRAVPCSPERVPIYVCGVTRCEIRGCYKVDPAVGGVHYSQIPPGAQTVRLSDLPVVSRTCCECETVRCATVPLTVGNPQPDDPCYGAAAGRTCCCSQIRDENGNPHALGRLRIVEWSCVQDISGGFGTLHTDVHIREDTREVDANGCESFIVESVQVQNGGSPVIVSGERSSLGCEVCGQWRLRAPRELISSPWLPFQTITGEAGREWGEQCQGYFSPETGETLTVDEWFAGWECTNMVQVARYHYINSFGTVIDTTFRFRAVIVRPDGSEGDSCNDRCAGNIRGGDSPPEPAQVTTGCGGCAAASQKRTKV